jgi:OFA family oxalate/formate antiporter-like MFS transporter
LSTACSTADGSRFFRLSSWNYFGGRNIGALIGILYTSVAFGTLVGPSAAGFAFDISGSFTVPILVSVCANLIAAGIMALASGAPALTFGVEG